MTAATRSEMSTFDDSGTKSASVPPQQTIGLTDLQVFPALCAHLRKAGFPYVVREIEKVLGQDILKDAKALPKGHNLKLVSSCRGF